MKIRKLPGAALRAKSKVRRLTIAEPHRPSDARPSIPSSAFLMANIQQSILRSSYRYRIKICVSINHSVRCSLTQSQVELQWLKNKSKCIHGYLSCLGCETILPTSLCLLLVRTRCQSPNEVNIPLSIHPPVAVFSQKPRDTAPMFLAQSRFCSCFQHKSPSS